MTVIVPDYIPSKIYFEWQCHPQRNLWTFDEYSFEKYGIEPEFHDHLCIYRYKVVNGQKFLLCQLKFEQHD